MRLSLRHYPLRRKYFDVMKSSLRHYLLRNSFYYVLDSRQTHDAINSLLSLSFMVFIIASTPLQLKNSFLVVSFFLKSSINLSEICFRTLSLVELESKRPTNGRTRHSSSANISFAFFSFLNFWILNFRWRSRIEKISGKIFLKNFNLGQYQFSKFRWQWLIWLGNRKWV